MVGLCGMARDHTSHNGVWCHMMNSIKFIAYNQKQCRKLQQALQERGKKIREKHSVSIQGMKKDYCTCRVHKTTLPHDTQP